MSDLTPEIEEMVVWLRGVLDEIEMATLGVLDRLASPGVVAERVLSRITTYRALTEWAVVWLERGVAPWNAEALRIIAAHYAALPGYKEEWRP